jgi:hypothetical protein
MSDARRRDLRTPARDFSPFTDACFTRIVLSDFNAERLRRSPSLFAD